MDGFAQLTADMSVNRVNSYAWGNLENVMKNFTPKKKSAYDYPHQVSAATISEYCDHFSNFLSGTLEVDCPSVYAPSSAQAPSPTSGSPILPNYIYHRDSDIGFSHRDYAIPPMQHFDAPILVDDFTTQLNTFHCADDTGDRSGLDVADDDVMHWFGTIPAGQNEAVVLPSLLPTEDLGPAASAETFSTTASAPTVQVEAPSKEPANYFLKKGTPSSRTNLLEFKILWNYNKKTGRTALGEEQAVISEMKKSRQVRRKHIEKWLQKRRRRTFKKKVKYHIRKSIAIGAQRSKSGRFAKTIKTEVNVFDGSQAKLLKEFPSQIQICC